MRRAHRLTPQAVTPRDAGRSRIDAGGRTPARRSRPLHQPLAATPGRRPLLEPASVADDAGTDAGGRPRLSAGTRPSATACACWHCRCRPRARPNTASPPCQANTRRRWAGADDARLRTAARPRTGADPELARLALTRSTRAGRLRRCPLRRPVCLCPLQPRHLPHLQPDDRVSDMLAYNASSKALLRDLVTRRMTEALRC